MTTTIRGSDNFDSGIIKAVALLAEVQPPNTNGGSSDAGWQTRVINTELSDASNITSLSNNHFQLQAGTYLIEWRCPAYRANRHTSRLYNVTDATIVGEGSSEYTETADSPQTNTFGTVVLTLATTKDFRIEHWYTTGTGGTGLGVASNVAGTNEVYTQVKISKIGV